MKITVIGAGLSGLMAGKILAENDFDVEILEADGVCGGLAKSAEMEGHKIPIFYHHIFSHDSTTLNVIKELGMENQLIWKKIRMGITFGDVIYRISPLNTLFWDFLSFKDKIRLGKLYLRMKVKKEWSDIEGADAKQWLENAVGKNVAEKIFKNIMIEKYGLTLDQVSASELAERLANEEATGKFAYPRNGLHKMVEGLVSAVERRGGTVRTNAEIKKIDIKSNKVCGIKTSKSQSRTDIVINTAPIPPFLKMAPGLPKGYAQRLGRIKYCKNICVNVGLEEHLGEYYWVNCFKQDIGGIIEHTNIADIYPFKFAWIFKYAPRENVWKLGDRQVSELFVAGMKKIYPESKPLWSRVFRCGYASPIYDINYKKYAPDYKTPVKNLFMSGIALTYPKIRNMNTAFLSGIKTSDIILAEIENRKHGECDTP